MIFKHAYNYSRIFNINDANNRNKSNNSSVVAVVVLLVGVCLGLALKVVKAESNYLIRVDGYSPTCFTRERCREFTVTGTAISVDKSLPYLGSNYCCITFDITDEDLFNENQFYPKFMYRIVNNTELKGHDFISVFEGDQKSTKLIRNMTANETSKRLHEPKFVDGSRVTFEFYKDKQFRTTFEIVVTAYHDINSPLCSMENFFRCGDVCIDRDLVCDKYPHCPDSSDELESVCDENDQSTLNYDYTALAIAMSILFSTIGITLSAIFVLCYFRTHPRVSRIFGVIFGPPPDEKEKELYFVEEDSDNQMNDQENMVFTLNEQGKKSFRAPLRSKSVKKKGRKSSKVNSNNTQSKL